MVKYIYADCAEDKISQHCQNQPRPAEKITEKGQQRHKVIKRYSNHIHPINDVAGILFLYGLGQGIDISVPNEESCIAELMQ